MRIHHILAWPYLADYCQRTLKHFFLLASKMATFQSQRGGIICSCKIRGSSRSVAELAGWCASARQLIDCFRRDLPHLSTPSTFLPPSIPHIINLVSIQYIWYMYFHRICVYLHCIYQAACELCTAQLETFKKMIFYHLTPQNRVHPKVKLNTCISPEKVIWKQNYAGSIEEFFVFDTVCHWHTTHTHFL